MTSEAPRRLHPAAIVVEAVGTAARLIVTALVLAFVGNGSITTALGYGALAIAASVGLGWLGWRSRTYWLDDVALHYRSGLFTPDERVVPRARVQAVDTTLGPIQRIFGVVELHVQVPGASSKEEVVLPAVTYAEAARLRSALGQPTPAQPDERVRLGLRDLLLAALTGPQISAAVSAVAGMYAVADNVIDVERDGEGLLARVDTMQEIALAAGLALAAGYLLSFLGAVVVFAGFEAQRDSDVLRIRRGLLSRRAQSIPLDRIDGVVIVEGLLRGPLGLAALRLESVAGGEERAAAKTLLPLVRLRDAEAVIARLVPSLTVQPGELERPPPRALRRFMLAPVLAAVVAGGALAVFVPAAWPVLPALVVVAAAAGFRAYRAAGMRLAGEIVVVREARMARRTLLARRHRLQEHAIASTILQTHAALADLHVTVGSGGGGRARHLEAATAQAAFGALRR